MRAQTAAARWLKAFRAADMQELAVATHFPFESHDESGNCQERAASARAELPTVLGCLLQDSQLLELLQGADLTAMRALSKQELVTWARTWSVSTPPAQLASLRLEQRDGGVRLDLAIVDGGVEAVWKTGATAAWPVELATRWMAGIRERDVARVGSATAYPFEIHDANRDATCGHRVAESREALALTIDCLLSSESLRQAMSRMPAPRFAVHQSDSTIPSWIDPGWRKSQGRTWKRVSTMVSTAEGNEYDFQMLVAPDGVRVVWKYGAFEARE